MSDIVESALAKNELNDHARQFLTLIFLQKMTRSLYRRMRLIASSRDCRLEQKLSSFRDRIAIAERGQKWLLPTSEDLPGLTICRHLRIVGCDGHEDGELARASLEALLWKGRIVSCHNFGTKCACASTLDDLPDRESRCLLREFAPCHERVTDWAFTGRQSGIRGDDARKSLWMFCGDAQSDHSSPVLAHQGHHGKIQLLDEWGGPVYVPFIGVAFALHRFVRASEADQIRRDSAQSRRDKNGNQFSI